MEQPQTFEEAMDPLLAELRELMIDRQYKYGPDNISIMAVHGLIVRINDKLSRIKEDHKNCSFLGECTLRNLPDEAREDAWKDLANYGGINALMLMRGQWGLPLAHVARLEKGQFFKDV